MARTRDVFCCFILENLLGKQDHKLYIESMVRTFLHAQQCVSRLWVSPSPQKKKQQHQMVLYTPKTTHVPRSWQCLLNYDKSRTSITFLVALQNLVWISQQSKRFVHKSYPVSLKQSPWPQSFYTHNKVLFCLSDPEILFLTKPLLHFNLTAVTIAVADRLSLVFCNGVWTVRSQNVICFFKSGGLIWTHQH